MPIYERGETQSFYNEFFEVFGVRRRRVASFEEPVKKLGGKQDFIDMFWKGVLLVEHKSAGRKLAPAKTQALEYFPGLKDSELPRYLLLSEGQQKQTRGRKLIKSKVSFCQNWCYKLLQCLSRY